MLIKNKNDCWLRINGHVEGKSSLRTLIEELWSIRDQILYPKDLKTKNSFAYPSMNYFMNSLELSNKNLKQLINKGIKLVEEDVLEKMTECFVKGENVKLSSFGTFSVRSKKERIGRNPKTGIEARISPRRVLSFHPSISLRKRVNK